MPPDAREDFRAWSDAITTVDPSSPERWRDAWHELGGYLVRLIAAKREAPADDLLSMLIATLGERSPDFELATLAVQLLIAGNETTLNQLGAVVHVLLREPEAYAALCAAPELVPSAIEELLRLHPPNDPLLRAATRDLRIGDTLVPEGSGVLVDPAAANRDPAVFDDPDRLDLRRTGEAHLTFGTRRPSAWAPRWPAPSCASPSPDSSGDSPDPGRRPGPPRSASTPYAPCPSPGDGAYFQVVRKDRPAYVAGDRLFTTPSRHL